jgi:SPP1 family phage portal protein
MSDLKILYDAISAKRSKYDALDGYYNGSQPTVYLTKRMREIFRPLDITFVENWCSVVIDACQDRINLTGFSASNTQAEKLLAEAWERNQMALDAADVHTDSLVLGECYAIVWPGEDGKAEVFYNDPRLVSAIYSGDNPRKIMVAGKLWRGDDGKAKMTLYYPDRLEYYTSQAEIENVSSAAAFELDTTASATGTAPNPYGEVPVFHFKTNRGCVSDLTNVIPLQNGVNKLLSDMMVAAEFGAYRQRWVISQGGTDGLKNAPGEIFDFPAGDGTGQDTSVGTFETTDLANYLSAIDKLSAAIGIITRTPKHFFYTQGGDPSGEALIAMEAPLNRKAQDRIDRFRPVWRSIAALICRIEGVAINPVEITPVFEKPETVQPKTRMEIIKLSVESTIPLDTALADAGWTQAQIDAMNKIKDESASKAQAGLAASLLKAQQDFKNQPMPQGKGNNLMDGDDQNGSN